MVKWLATFLFFLPLIVSCNNGEAVTGDDPLSKRLGPTLVLIHETMTEIDKLSDADRMALCTAKSGTEGAGGSYLAYVATLYPTDPTKIPKACAAFLGGIAKGLIQLTANAANIHAHSESHKFTVDKRPHAQQTGSPDASNQATADAVSTYQGEISVYDFFVIESADRDFVRTIWHELMHVQGLNGPLYDYDPYDPFRTDEGTKEAIDSAVAAASVYAETSGKYKKYFPDIPPLTPPNDVQWATFVLTKLTGTAPTPAQVTELLNGQVLPDAVSRVVLATKLIRSSSTDPTSVWNGKAALITGVWTKLVKRKPSASELATEVQGWTDYSRIWGDAGATNDYVTTHWPAGDASAFATAIFYDYLLRAPVADELSHWVGSLSQTPPPIVTLFANLTRVPEFRLRLTKDAYQAYIGKDPEKYEIDYYAKTWLASPDALPFDTVLANVIGCDRAYTKAMSGQ